jgi:hypothetical protein
MKQSFFNRISLFAAMLIMVLVLSGAAHASGTCDCSSMAPQKAKTGHLTITSATDVGGVTLEPGDYDVKQIKSKTGPKLRFSRVVYEPYVQDAGAWERETVAEVRVTTQQLCSKANSTELLLASDNNKPIGMEIRGNSFDYMF